MDADTRKAQDIFKGSDRYLVPAYQRPYIWQEEKQWQPLWDDLEKLADSNLEGAVITHFLGAVVLKQESTSPGGFTEWSVIDGQQRLTTLQLLFSAMAQAAEEDNVPVEARRLRRLTLHDEDDAEGDELFRFWPTTVNQEAYRNVMRAEGPDQKRIDDADNTIEEAWTFFRRKASEYAVQEGAELDMSASNYEEKITERYGALRRAAVGMIEVVAIQLGKDDPSQVVFETLNARGTPLLSTDLIKNALFEKAQKMGYSLADIHDEYWMPGLGDHEYWSKDDKQVRNTVPRSESFLMQWLAMKSGKTASADALFDRFRRQFLDGSNPADPIDLLRELRDDSLLVRGFESRPVDTPEGALLATSRLLDTTVFNPLIMLLLKLDLPTDVRAVAFGSLESYMMRRVICRLSRGSYTNLVSELISAIDDSDGRVDEVIVARLISSQSSSFKWPTDEEVTDVLLTQPLYGVLGRGRIRDLLSAVEASRRQSNKTEDTGVLPSSLQIEHLLPQSWQKNWPLIDKEDQLANESRDRHINLLGNLTLVAGGLNASMSNSDWNTKRAALNTHSVLLINKDLESIDCWDEEAIDHRGKALSEKIIERWPGPQKHAPEDWSAPGAEHNLAATDISKEQMGVVFSESTNYLRDLLINLSENADQRRKYSEICDSLGWPAARLPSVFSAYSRRHGADSKRPFHINLDQEGSWTMWMDSRVAGIVSLLLNEAAEGRDARIKAAKESISVDAVSHLFDIIEDKVAAEDGLSIDFFGGHGESIRFFGIDGLRANGYFAKQWLFLWLKIDRFTGDYEWLQKHLSKPNDVVVNKRDGSIRLHVANEQDFDAILRLLNSEELR
jgi:hypothetical protein